MLNISQNSITGQIESSRLRSLNETELWKGNRMFTRWLLSTLLLIIIFLFLPWTQNIQSKGKVTTLRPEQRPQTIQSTIAGRIEKWYVKEGEIIAKGDTIVFLSEIKAEYFDPDMVNRTNLQVDAKAETIGAYRRKAEALDDQISAYRSEREYKMEQLKNKIRQTELKIISDSLEVRRADIDYVIAQRQVSRTETMYNEGIAPLVDLEEKRIKVQSTQTKLVEAQNKLETSRNDLLNAKLELNTVRFEYNQKIAKAESDKFSTLSDLYNAEGSLNKLQIEASNYTARNQFYYITAPQDCYITKALKPGIGETVKEGEEVVSIMPVDYDLAVELYIKPMDLPLVNYGQEVRFIFDGWPAFIFSGWPGQSFGTFSGQVVAIDNEISENGMYRILVGPDPDRGKPWPEALRPGGGAQGIALLNNVPLWYEVWRKLNGFPPDFYDSNTEEMPKLKAPAKSIK